MNIGFDEILTTPIVSTDNIGISPTGQHVVSSSLYSDTFSERPERSREKPVKIINGSSDTIGFFGENVYMLAIASGDILRIIDFHNQRNIATMVIRPGSLFVPDSAESPFIGAVSPRGRAVIIDENAEITKTDVYADPGHIVLWTSTARPVGEIWSDEEGAANLYIRSSNDTGSIVTSSYGINVFSVWANPETHKHEAYFSTDDTPHKLQKVTSSDEGAEIEDVYEFPVGAEINQIVKLPNGKPSNVTAIYASRVHSHPLENDVSPAPVDEMIRDIVSDESRMTYIKMVGHSTYASWTQTPITRPVPAMVMYGIEGRPRYELKGNIIDAKPIRPTTNEVIDFEVSKDYTLSFRLVSPYPADGKYTASHAIVIADELGYDAAGGFSPTVRMLYQLGIPVAIVPFRRSGAKNKKADLAMFSPDVNDVTRLLVKKNLCSSTILMGNDDLCIAMLEAMRMKRNTSKKCILINPHNHIAQKIAHRKTKGKVVSAYFGVNEDDIQNPEKSVYFDIDEMNETEIYNSVAEFIEEYATN